MVRYCLDCKDPIQPEPGQTKRRDRCPACNKLALVLLGIDRNPRCPADSEGRSLRVEFYALIIAFGGRLFE